ncbi:metallophosphoesterase family protein [Paenibacillus ehimensis]|uniref:metallophosphoesterase family protein n=1 Tax=Paenibacillus ehimensis TaxID=79264 RepID=UPI002DBCC77C|nr:metallophosphoesterase family protein [Paenibacillus ehimensis]MEC0209708.1 metallophosphoesterase family protein [Paenibacillus ehimensis]
MKNRTLVISDIHGCYDEFVNLLSVIKYEPAEDELILLGDYCDRGFKSKEVIDFILNLHKDSNTIVLRGNHDQMFLDALNGGDDYLFLHNGGIDTIESYCGLNWFENYQGFDFNRYLEAKKFILTHYKQHIDFLNSLPFYHETEEFIFTHAGLNPFYENWKEQPNDNFLWIRDIFINNITQVDKTVIFGHTPTINMKDEDCGIWFGGDKIGIDGGCCFGFQMNCLEICEEGYKTYYVESKSKKR